MSSRAICLFGLILLALFPVRADGKEQSLELPFDLLQRSLKTPSASERAVLRAQLAREYRDSAEGLFSAAWLAIVDGRQNDGIRLYEAAIYADPELTIAYVNLGLAHEAAGRFDEARTIYDKALATAPFDTDLVRNGYFLRKEKQKDPEEAARFLDKWQAAVGNVEYAFDFVRGIDAEVEGRHVEAEKHYLSAIGKDAPLEVYQRLATLRMDKLYGDVVPKVQRFNRAVEAMDPLIKDQNAAAYLFLGRMLRDKIGDGRFPLTYLSRSFDLHPSSEAAIDVFRQMARHDIVGARAFLEKARAMLSDNYDLRSGLAWVRYQFDAEPDRAAALALEAFELAPHEEGRLAAALTFGLALDRFGRFDEADAFYRMQLERPWASARRRQILMARVENRIAAQEFAKAREVLNMIAAEGGANSGWLAWKGALLDRAVRLQEQDGSHKRAAHGTPPATDAAPIVAQTGHVLFTVGSSTLSHSARAALDTLGAGLKSSGSDAPALSVEGHADATGSEAGNQDLSLRRAVAVRRYLVERHRIAPVRLRISGYGGAEPVASNLDRQGRLQNRRVELWPFEPGATERPLIDRGAAMSPDGRHAVLGEDPPQLWDLRANARRRDLHRGRSHRFSPDGRHIASLSSFREEGGRSTEAIFIHEVSSGRVVAQLYEALEVIDVVWRPDGRTIAFSTADGFLKVHDLAARRHVAVTRMGPTQIGGPLAWFPDGRTLAGGQHRMKEIILRDATTLAETKRLEGVDWPHALGVDPDGRYLVAFDNARRMSVWDMRRGARLRQTAAPTIPLDLLFHPVRPLVVINARFAASDTAFAVMDIARVSQRAHRPGKGTHVTRFSSDGRTLFAGTGASFLSFNLRKMKLATPHVDGDGPSQQLRASER